MTAVEFFVDESMKLVAQAMTGTLNEDTIENDVNIIVTKAKEMEKEQMHSEYMRGWKDGLIKQGPPTPPLDRKIWK
jgi:hypothetical protein